MKKLPLLTAITASMLLTGCDLKFPLFDIFRNNSSQESIESTSELPENASFTLMTYICGADLESQTDTETGKPLGLASMDIDEMLSVKNQPENVNIVLQTGGAKKWKKSVIKNTELGRWHIRDNKLEKDEAVSKASMGQSKTLQSFIEWSIDHYPADRYGLILWNHGGAMDGCCYDELYNDDSLTNAEVYSAVTNARQNKNITNKFEFIAYDACLMAVQDIVEMNSHNFKYMVSSQEAESGYGYCYDKWLPSLYGNTRIDGGELLEVVAHTFMEEQYEIYNYYNEACDQTQSVFDLSKAEAYLNAWEDMASDLATIVNSSSKWSTLKSTVNKCQKYGGYQSGFSMLYPYDIFDARELLTNMKKTSSYSSLSEKLNKIDECLSELVIYEEHGSGIRGSGICFFCPISGYSVKSNYSNTNTNFENWRSICTKYGSWY